MDNLSKLQATCSCSSNQDERSLYSISNGYYIRGIRIPRYSASVFRQVQCFGQLQSQWKNYKKHYKNVNVFFRKQLGSGATTTELNCSEQLLSRGASYTRSTPVVNLCV